MLSGMQSSLQAVVLPGIQPDPQAAVLSAGHAGQFQSVEDGWHSARMEVVQNLLAELKMPFQVSAETS